MKRRVFIVVLGIILWGGTAFGDPILIKNFREIYSSYASIMQVDQKSPELLELYRLNKDRLPASGLPSELSSPVVLAMTELAGAFCIRTVEKEKGMSIGERVLFGDVDFAAGPVQFQGFLKKKLSHHLARLFWLRDASAEELVSLSKHMDKLGTENPNSPEATSRLLHILCTTFGTSLAFLVK